MILTSEVKVMVMFNNIETYRKLGYDVESNKEIIVNIKDLPLNSRKIVDVKCDNCGAIKELRFSDYMAVFNKKNKYYCFKCKGESIRKGVQKIYGENVDNVFQLKTVKDKLKKTCKELYGVDHHLQNKDILQKLIDTNQKLYGVDFIPQLKKHTNESYIEKCKKAHGDLYDYSKVDFKHVEGKVIIVCKKHGPFQQRAEDHFRGLGCPNCKISKGENFIMEYLNDHEIPYMQQKKFADCKHKTSLPFDFFIPEKNLCI